MLSADQHRTAAWTPILGCRVEQHLHKFLGEARQFLATGTNTGPGRKTMRDRDNHPGNGRRIRLLGELPAVLRGSKVISDHPIGVGAEVFSGR